MYDQATVLTVFDQKPLKTASKILSVVNDRGVKVVEIGHRLFGVKYR